MLIESYSEVLRSKTHYNKAILCCLDIYSRYAGAREAVFTAICRKNLVVHILLLVEIILVLTIILQIKILGLFLVK